MTLNGTVKDGAIQLAEPVVAPNGTRVIITVLENTTAGAAVRVHRPITRGMFANELKSDTRVDDFKGLLEREWERSWDRLERQ